MNTPIINSDVMQNNLTSKKSFMTTQEVADALNVSQRTIQKKALELGFSAPRGARTELNEQQVTAIKNALNVNANYSNAQLDVIQNATTDAEMELLTQKVMAYHIAKANEYKARAEQAEAINAENAPKVEFYNQVTDSKQCIDMGAVAKVLNFKNYGRNTLFELLRNKGILQSNNLPYQKYIDAGYFRVVESKWVTPTGEIKISLKTIVFQKGVDYIRQIILQDIKENLSDPGYMQNAIEDAAEKYIEEKRLQEGR